MKTDTNRPDFNSTPIDLHVLDGVELHGRVNVDDDGLRANVAHSIRLGFPQVRPQPIQADRVLLVGGGPSLEATERELVELYHAGAKIFALNGAVEWCLARNLRPSAQIIVDARPHNARFLATPIPRCRYLIASQCHPDTWAAANDGRDNVWIWHAADPDESFAQLLEAYYFGRWHGIAGGTTVAMRGLCLLRLLGYYRFDLFGIDSCWLGETHHAYAQPENGSDQRVPFQAWPTGSPHRARSFLVSNWHLKQLEDFLQLLRVAGEHFLLNIHGDGLLAFALREAAEIEWEAQP